MEKKVLLLLGAMMLAVAANASGPSRLSNPIQEVSFTNVHLSDGFWSPLIETNRTVSIHSAFHE